MVLLQEEPGALLLHVHFGRRGAVVLTWLRAADLSLHLVAAPSMKDAHAVIKSALACPVAPASPPPTCDGAGQPL